MRAIKGGDGELICGQCCDEATETNCGICAITSRGGNCGSGWVLKECGFEECNSVE